MIKDDISLDDDYDKYNSHNDDNSALKLRTFIRYLGLNINSTCAKETVRYHVKHVRRRRHCYSQFGVAAYDYYSHLISMLAVHSVRALFKAIHHRSPLAWDPEGFRFPSSPCPFLSFRRHTRPSIPCPFVQPVLRLLAERRLWRINTYRFQLEYAP